MNNKTLHKALTVIATIAVANAAHGQIKGPSTGSTPYLVPFKSGIETISIATVDNTGANPDDTLPRLGGGAPYNMVGIPDGLGAFDNGDGTFTILMNHELGNTAGVIREHGSIGAFVSRFVVDKNTLAVVGARDLITSVFTFNIATLSYNPRGTTVFGRLCSADLPPVSAFSNGALGTTERIFMNGEEAGSEGRAFANIATGPNAGTSYELPRLGKFSWENSIASPFQQDKTVVVGTDDTTPGQVYVYIGTKTSTGTEVERAGLTNGALYGIKVTGFPLEDRNNSIGITKGNSTPFTTQIKNTNGDVSGLTGAQLQANSLALGITEFLRPEDAAWDTQNPNRFYFVTTDRYDQVKDGVGPQIGRSRLYAVEFNSIANPENGGQITLLLDGTEPVANGGQNMMDNIGVDADGNVLIVEDVGNQQHNGKLSRYNAATGTLEVLAQHDRARFGDIGIPATSPFNQDEEASGIIEITSIMAGSALQQNNPGERWYLADDQAHYNTGATAEQVEGGQLFVVHQLGVTPARSGYVRNRRTRTYAQQITLTNTLSTALPGPFYVVLDNLSANAALANATGTTANNPPLGRPYITVPGTGAGLAAGASASVTLQFTNPSNAAITYTTRVLNGSTAP